LKNKEEFGETDIERIEGKRLREEFGETDT